MGNGFNQHIGVDSGEAFNPLVKTTTTQMVLSISISKSWCLYQLDLKNSFLIGNISEIVYMYQSLGFVIFNNLITCAWWGSLCMVLNKHPVLGTNVLLNLFLH